MSVIVKIVMLTGPKITKYMPIFVHDYKRESVSVECGGNIDSESSILWTAVLLYKKRVSGRPAFLTLCL